MSLEPDRSATLFAELLRDQPLLLNIVLRDREGNRRASAVPSAPPESISGRPYVDQVIQTAPASARIEAVAPFGAPVFIFAAAGGDATLLLPRDNRVLEHGRSDAVLEAVTGLPLDAAALRSTLTGCASPGAAASAAREPAADWRIVADGATDLYLHREGGRWRIVAAVHHAPPEWRVEYAAFQPSGLPQSVRLANLDRRQFDLRLTLSQVDTNVTLGPEVFRVQIPRGAQPVTIDELRHARPGIRED